MRQDGATQLRPVQSEENVGIRTIAYLPKGLAYALFAPFPWDLRRTLDALTVPEMLTWYVLFVAAVWTAWIDRRRWRTLAPLLAFVIGMMFVFALAEGNVGTLFRHRGMVIPTVAVLAAPTLVALAARAPGSAPARAVARMLPARVAGRTSAP